VVPGKPTTWTKEYSAVRSALRRILHRKMWQADPLTVDDEDGDANQHDATGAREIRRQLDAAIAS
jgi:hypothetical protein